MPSLTSSTVPTSRTSISARSAAWISLRRISLSSPGLRMESVAIAPRSRDCEKYHIRSEEHTSELQSPCNLVCRLLLEKKKNINSQIQSTEQLENTLPVA